MFFGSVVLGVLCLAVSVQSNYRVTWVLVEKATFDGEDIFMRGSNFDNDGSIRIVHPTYPDLGNTKYDAWKEGDTKLTWGGAEPGQGRYENGGSWEDAHGTPMMWSTNDPSNSLHEKIWNKYGDHYWYVKLYMDCDDTPNRLFKFKVYSDVNGWEGNLDQGDCVLQKVDGKDANGIPILVDIPHTESLYRNKTGRASDGNRVGVCGGYVNVYHADGTCVIIKCDC